MQSASSLSGMSFRKNLRPGQAEVCEKVQEFDRRSLSVKLPTGYGKTFAAACSYAILKADGRANRMLYIVPTTKQLDQFEQDGHKELYNACVEGPDKVVDLSFFTAKAIEAHRRDTAQVFVTTIQAMITRAGMDRVRELMETGRWMVVVDEYHHYGVDATWGKSVLKLNYAFLLAMSATPHRPDADGAFGAPEVEVMYRDAANERAVKKLKAYSYVYRIDVIEPDLGVKSYTTSELLDELDVSDGDPKKLEKRRIERQMRWSPMYVSPLIRTPIERMQKYQIITGYPLQTIIGAMCVSHAELICEQVRDMYPELRIDWVGTGDDGRDPAENKRVLAKFCPPKDERDERHPTLDVLVHVGMAGEGMDSIYVSEVIHLNPASVNNTNNQENGRVSRYLDGVVGNINFDSSSGYARAGYVGDSIMDAMDMLAPNPSPCEKCSNDPCTCVRKPKEFEPLPPEPAIHIQRMEVIRIDSGEVERMKRIIATNPAFPTFTEADLDDPDSGLAEFALEAYRQARALEAEQHNEKSIVAQWNELVKRATSTVRGQVVDMLSGTTNDTTTLAALVAKRINWQKKRDVGEMINNDIEVIQRHYHWLRSLEAILINEGLPEWLQL